MQPEKLDRTIKPAPGLGLVNVNRQANGTLEFSGGDVGGTRPQYAGTEAAGFRTSSVGGNLGMNRSAMQSPTPGGEFVTAAPPAPGLGFRPGAAVGVGPTTNASAPQFGFSPAESPSELSSRLSRTGAGQIPGPSPVEVAGAANAAQRLGAVSGTEFSRNVSNTLGALAPIGTPAATALARGASKVLGVGSSPIVQSTLGYAAPLATGSALLNASESSSEAAKRPLTNAANRSASAGTTDATPPGLGFKTGRDLSRELGQVPRDLPADLRDGVIHKTRDANGRAVYSGRNVAEGAQMVDGTGRGAPGRGTVSTVPGMAPGEARAILDRPFDPRNAMNPAQRTQYDAEVAQATAINQATLARGSGSPTVGEALRLGMRRRAGDLAKQQSDIQTNEAQVQLGFRRQADTETTNAVTREQAQTEIQGARRLQALQDEYLAADTDAKRTAVAKKIQALQGKSETPNRYTVIPGGSVVDPATGLAVQQPGMVLDNSSGQLVDIGTGRGAQSGQANPYPEGTRLQGPGGKNYVVRDGKPVEE